MPDPDAFTRENESDTARVTGGSLPFVDEVTGALENLTAVLDIEDDFQVLIHQVCRQVTHALPGVDQATVTLLHHREPQTTAATGQSVAELDRDQYRTGDGPCLQAARTGQVVRVSVAEAGQYWPTFAGDARRAGFGSFLSAPLVIRNEYAGAINCYGEKGHGFAELDEQLIELYTTAVEAALRTYQRYSQARATAEHLTRALTTRAVIDQAKGILMAVHQISDDEAFHRISQQSQHENIKIHTLAERLVASATNQPNGDHPTDGRPTRA